jgi:hypothetical protein
MTKLFSKIKESINAILTKSFGIKIVRTHYSNYISADETIKAAEKAGLSICDYLEHLWHQEGATQLVIDEMIRLGSMDHAKSMVEIGAGSGRYMEKVIECANPQTYYSYEIAPDWSEYLASTYPISSCAADGRTLSSTSIASVDLIHAHGVFVYLPLFITLSYFQEINRVAAPGAWVIFDLYTEHCLNDEYLEKWLASGSEYPVIYPRQWIIDWFEHHNFTMVHSFYNAHGQGISEYLCFHR